MSIDSRLPAELCVRRRPSAGALLLGALLVFTLVFAAGYLLLDPYTFAALLDPVNTVMWSIVFVLAALLVVLAGLVLARSRGIQRDSSEGLRFLAIGRAAEAEAIFSRIERRNRWLWSVRIPARWNCAVSLLVQGRFDEALRRFALLSAEPYNERALPQIWEGLPSMVALCYALRGRLDEAEAALAEQERRRVQRHLMTWVLPQAVIACRRGLHEEVVRVLESEPRALETVYGSVLGRALRVVHAFSCEQAGRQVPPELRGAIGQLADGDVAWAREWPALDRWLRDGGWGSGRAA